MKHKIIYSGLKSNILIFRNGLIVKTITGLIKNKN